MTHASLKPSPDPPPRSDSTNGVSTTPIVQDRQFAAFSRVASVVAHELTNLLQILASSLDRLEPSVRSSAEVSVRTDEAVSAMQTIRSSMDRSTRVARQLQTFAQTTPPRLQPRELHQLMAAWMQDFEDTVGHDCRLELRLRHSGSVLVDAEQLHAALLNLLANAREASSPGALIVLELSRVARANGLTCRIAVIDHGEGMSEEVVRQAAAPFYTTRPPGKGMGLGLTIARMVTEAHGGSMEIDSAAGRGTTVVLYLPLPGGNARLPRETASTAGAFTATPASASAPSAYTAMSQAPSAYTAPSQAPSATPAAAPAPAAPGAPGPDPTSVASPSVMPPAPPSAAAPLAEPVPPATTPPTSAAPASAAPAAPAPAFPAPAAMPAAAPAAPAPAAAPAAALPQAAAPAPVAPAPPAAAAPAMPAAPAATAASAASAMPAAPRVTPPPVVGLQPGWPAAAAPSPAPAPPATQPPAAAPPPPLRAAPRSAGSVLVIDDEEAIAEYFRIILAAERYDVHVVVSAHQALERFAEDPQRYDAVLLDMMLRDGSGIDLYRSFRALRPDLRVVVCTGFSDNESLAPIRADGHDILYKPCPRSEVLKAIARAVAARRAAG